MSSVEPESELVVGLLLLVVDNAVVVAVDVAGVAGAGAAACAGADCLLGAI